MAHHDFNKLYNAHRSRSRTSFPTGVFFVDVPALANLSHEDPWEASNHCFCVDPPISNIEDIQCYFLIIIILIFITRSRN